MIFSDRQLAVSKEQLEKLRFAHSVVQADIQKNSLLRAIEEKALQSQIGDIEQELAEYELLKSGSINFAESFSLSDLPRILIQARIAKGLSQTDLASLLNMKAQQIQRYEATVTGCGADCASPWGHAKGMVAWNDSGAGFVIQVTTPSWPGSGNQEHPRQSDGNTLGCTLGNNVKFSQHFFALKTTKQDLIKILEALHNASVGTDPENPQIVNNGGPVDIQNLVTQLGHRSSSTMAMMATLSSGVQLISKPSKLKVPPWQMVSSLLGGVPLRTATWWATPTINSTTATTHISCWDAALSPSGAVDIATSGKWDGTKIGLKGFVHDGNHAKIGVSTDDNSDLSIFGDLNQQGVLSDSNCARSQNGRGGLFFVIKDRELAKSIGNLITGDSAPTD